MQAGKVFVGGLTQTTTDDQLRDYFSQYGTLVDVVVMKDRASQRSRGFGFVQFDDAEPVDRVMANYSSHQLDGKWVEVKRAQPKERMPASNPPPSSQLAPYGGGRSGGPPPSSQFYPWAGSYPPHPYGAYGMQYGYYQQPPGYSPYAAYATNYGAPACGMPGPGPPPGAYGGGGGGDSRARPY